MMGVFIIRTIVFWGLHWGPPILGKYHINHSLLSQVSALMTPIKLHYIIPSIAPLMDFRTLNPIQAPI